MALFFVEYTSFFTFRGHFSCSRFLSQVWLQVILLMRIFMTIYPNLSMSISSWISISLLRLYLIRINILKWTSRQDQTTYSAITALSIEFIISCLLCFWEQKRPFLFHHLTKRIRLSAIWLLRKTVILETRTSCRHTSIHHLICSISHWIFMMNLI